EIGAAARQAYGSCHRRGGGGGGGGRGGRGGGGGGGGPPPKGVQAFPCGWGGPSPPARGGPGGGGVLKGRAGGAPGVNLCVGGSGRAWMNWLRTSSGSGIGLPDCTANTACMTSMTVLPV